MTNPNVDALNDITKTLIDSQKGYDKVCEIADDSFTLRDRFQSLSAERRDMIKMFQAHVRDYGGTPETSGGGGGALHRAWADFTSLFQSDQKAALDAVEGGEEHLAKEISSKLEHKDLDQVTRDLLERARASACYGENFADRAEDTLD